MKSYRNRYTPVIADLYVFIGSCFNTILLCPMMHAN